MKTHAVDLSLITALLTLVLSACSGEMGSLGEQEVVDIAWKAFEPNTSSHNRANWEVGLVRRAKGRDVAEEFAGKVAPGCPGPKPPAAGEIEATGSYWYVQMKRRPATPVAQESTVSPTAPPRVPEPFTYDARFLIDADGQVVARKLFCVIY